MGSVKHLTANEAQQRVCKFGQVHVAVVALIEFLEGAHAGKVSLIAQFNFQFFDLFFKINLIQERTRQSVLNFGWTLFLCPRFVDVGTGAELGDRRPLCFLFAETS